jgi:hypothetical protein
VVQLGDVSLRKRVKHAQTFGQTNMIKVIALTQFVFLALGIMSAIIRARAAGRTMDPILGVSPWWVIVIPPAWIAFAALCSRCQKAPLSPSVARASGIILALFAFLFTAVVTFSTRP